jgi:hypothetical protein
MASHLNLDPSRSIAGAKGAMPYMERLQRVCL